MTPQHPPTAARQPRSIPTTSRQERNNAAREVSLQPGINAALHPSRAIVQPHSVPPLWDRNSAIMQLGSHMQPHMIRTLRNTATAEPCFHATMHPVHHTSRQPGSFANTTHCNGAGLKERTLVQPGDRHATAQGGPKHQWQPCSFPTRRCNCAGPQQ